MDTCKLFTGCYCLLLYIPVIVCSSIPKFYLFFPSICSICFINIKFMGTPKWYYNRDLKHYVIQWNHFSKWFMKIFKKHVVYPKLDIYVFTTITGLIPLLMDYKYQISTFLLLSLGWYLYWWTISIRYLCFYYYHWVDTSTDGL